MNPEDKKNLLAAWELHHKILTDIKRLANVNPSLAYGVIRTAEMVIDLIFVRRAREIEEKYCPPKEEK